jgi:hypothetical protein
MLLNSMLLCMSYSYARSGSNRKYKCPTFTVPITIGIINVLIQTGPLPHLKTRNLPEDTYIMWLLTKLDKTWAMLKYIPQKLLTSCTRDWHLQIVSIQSNKTSHTSHTRQLQFMLHNHKTQRAVFICTVLFTLGSQLFLMLQLSSAYTATSSKSNWYWSSAIPLLILS